MLLFSFSLLPTDLIFERLANQNAGKSVKKEEKEKNVLFTVNLHCVGWRLKSQKQQHVVPERSQ